MSVELKKGESLELLGFKGRPGGGRAKGKKGRDLRKKIKRRVLEYIIIRAFKKHSHG